MEGTGIKMDHTFDRILDFYWLYSGEFDYRQETSKYASPNDKHEDDIIHVFYSKKK